MISCLIVDDSSIARDDLIQKLSAFSEIEVISSCESVLKAEQILQENQNIQAIFLDIEMPDISGLEWAKILKSPPFIVFVSSHPEFALEGFEVNALDYLLKPVTQPRLIKTIRKLKDVLHYTSQNFTPTVEYQNDYFFIRVEGDFVKIPLEELIYLEAVGDFTSFYLKNDIKYFALVSLKQLEQHLPEAIFMRVHRSFIVNIKEIEVVGSYDIKAKGYTIPVSKSAREELYQKVIANRIIKRKN